MKKSLDFIGLFVIFFFSCKKNEFKGPAVSSLIVTNTVIGGTSVRLGSNIISIPVNNYRQLSLIAGDNDLYVWPIGDSTHPYYSNPKFSSEDRELYSLFVTGQSPNITGVLIKDQLPYHKDSTCGIRIINLSPNSSALNVTLSVTPTINEVSNLAYLQYTDFKLYPAKISNVSYVFQVRKATDNSLLASTNLFTPRFYNVTLVIRGSVGGSGSSAFGITRVNSDR